MFLIETIFGFCMYIIFTFPSRTHFIRAGARNSVGYYFARHCIYLKKKIQQFLPILVVDSLLCLSKDGIS